MSTPAIIYLVLSLIGLIAAAYLHGKPTKTNFWTTLLSAAIAISLLTWGGFFAPVFGG